jgi:hypothetical protein
MINSAQEIQQLCESVDTEAQHRADHDNAPDEVWFEVLEKYPEMAKWVIHNKTIPLSILRQLVTHSDPRIRWQVALGFFIIGILIMFYKKPFTDKPFPTLVLSFILF